MSDAPETASHLWIEPIREDPPMILSYAKKRVVHQFESRTISSIVQTWSAIPASIAGVTRKVL